MHLWVLFACVLGASETRHYYPYSTNYPYTTVQPPRLHTSVNDVTVVDERTGIKYNPYGKHHPGRHVCTNQRNVTYPTRAKRVFCKPTYKKYRVRCGTQWCEGVRLVYEKYHKEVVADNNHTVIDYTCCPGWSQVTWRSHGCNRPTCHQPCMNGGHCVKPNVCSCLPGYRGTYCETKTSVYAPPQCSPACLNGGTCSPHATCLCSSGYAGRRCERDIDECKKHKPCDQICYNTPGSYKCECKENFALQPDGQTCRKETDEDTAIEARDLEQQKLDKMDKRLQMLEKNMNEKRKNEVSQKDLQSINVNIDRLSKDITKMSAKIERLGGNSNVSSNSKKGCHRSNCKSYINVNNNNNNSKRHSKVSSNNRNDSYNISNCESRSLSVDPSTRSKISGSVSFPRERRYSESRGDSQIQSFKSYGNASKQSRSNNL